MRLTAPADLFTASKVSRFFSSVRISRRDTGAICFFSRRSLKTISVNIIDISAARSARPASKKISDCEFRRNSKILIKGYSKIIIFQSNLRNLLNFRRNSVQNFVSHRFQKSGDWDTVQASPPFSSRGRRTSPDDRAYARRASPDSMRSAGSENTI